MNLKPLGDRVVVEHVERARLRAPAACFFRTRQKRSRKREWSGPVCPGWPVRASCARRKCPCGCSTVATGRVGGWPRGGSGTARSTSGRRTSRRRTTTSSPWSRDGTSGGSRARGPTRSARSATGTRSSRPVRCAGVRRVGCARSSRTWPRPRGGAVRRRGRREPLGCGGGAGDARPPGPTPRRRGPPGGPAPGPEKMEAGAGPGRDLARAHLGRPEPHGPVRRGLRQRRPGRGVGGRRRSAARRRHPGPGREHDPVHR